MPAHGVAQVFMRWDNCPGNTDLDLDFYDGSDSLDGLFAASPSMRLYSRGLIYDALKACASDGELTEGERERVAAADQLDLPQETVHELEQIVHEEAALRRRKHKLIVADAFAAAGG